VDSVVLGTGTESGICNLGSEQTLALMRKDNRKKICERVDGCGLVGVFYMSM
jgi:hypothetical protein